MGKRDENRLGNCLKCPQYVCNLIILISVGMALVLASFAVYQEMVEEGTITLIGEGFTSGSLANNTYAVKVSTKTLLRNMAFELSTMKSATKGQLELLTDSIEQTKRSVDNQAQEVRQQRESIQRQGALLERQVHKVSQMEVAVSLPKAVAAKDRHFRHERISSSDPKDWHQSSWTRHGMYGFIQYSSYRLSPTKFVTVGLAALRMRDMRTFQGCRWFGNEGGSVDGELTMEGTDEHHSLRYEPALLVCTLNSVTGTAGGFLVAGLDDEEFVLLREDVYPQLDEPILHYKLTECSPPLFGELHGQAVREWFDWHRVIAGVDHFVMYNVNAFDSDVANHLKDYIHAGMMEVVDFSDATLYSVWSYAQALAQHDCVYRSRLNSKWVVMLDLDEFLNPMGPEGIGGLLKKYEDKAWLTHGSVWWGIGICNKDEGDDLFGLERMTFHWPGHYCTKKDLYPDWRFCLDDAGHRKMIVNPRKVFRVRVHRVVDPSEGGQDLNLETEMGHMHFQRYNLKERTDEKEPRCGRTLADDEKHDWWVRDRQLADAVKARIRTCPFGETHCVEQID